MTIGESIRAKRKSYDIEQQELASRIGVTKQLLSKIETDVAVPSVNVVIALAETLHCTTDELLGREPEPKGRKGKRKWTA